MKFVLLKTLEHYEFNNLGWPIWFEPVENNPTRAIAKCIAK